MAAMGRLPRGSHPPTEHPWFHAPPPLLALPPSFFASPHGQRAAHLSGTPRATPASPWTRHQPPDPRRRDCTYSSPSSGHRAAHAAHAAPHANVHLPAPVPAHADDVVWGGGGSVVRGAGNPAPTTPARHRHHVAGAAGHAVEDVDDVEAAASDSEGDSDSDGDEFEFVVSQEFLDFIAISAAHREERDRIKREKARYSRTVHMDERLSQVPTPLEAPDAARRHQLEALYGKAGDALQSLEACVNQLHDNGVDSLAPTLWPAIPIISEQSTQMS